MKKTFRLRSNSDPLPQKHFVAVLGVLVVVALIFFFGHSALLTTSAFLWRGESNVERGLTNLLSFFRSKEMLILENEKLKARLQALDSLVVYTRALESTTEELISHFGREVFPPSLAAGVLAHPPETPYDLLIIDVGRAQGVEVGDRVSLPESGALGKVAEVGEKISKVNLYSSSGEKTGAILERKHVPITLEGVGGGTFKFSVPRDISIEVGDKILLPGLRTELVGVVVQVELTPTDSEKHALVRALGNVSSIRFVSVHSI